MMYASDPSAEELDYGDTSDLVPVERPEASESGIITELEHRRSESMSSVDMRPLEGREDGSSREKKSGSGKSRRLSTRVARGLKKQFTSDTKSRPRSMSPPRSQRHLSVDDLDVDRPSSPVPPMRRTQTDTVSSNYSYEPKKKHKSKFKPVAKAAAAAAKKLAGKKSSSSGKHGEMSQSYTAGYTSTSRSTTPTNLHVTHPGSNNSSTVGKTPMNTPVNASTIVDRSTIDSVMQELPATLAEVKDEETELGADETEKSAEDSSSDVANEATAAAAPAPTLPTEDEALKLAEAMAMAVQSNPTKSQEEIRRMVYSQPEFRHLTPPEALVKPSSSSSGSSDSTSKLLKKKFSSIKKQITKDAGTAQKKLMEMAETNLGSSISSSFGFGYSSSSGSGSSSSKPPPPGSNIPQTTSGGSAAGSPSGVVKPVATIPENAQLSVDSEPSQNSLPSIGDQATTCTAPVESTSSDPTTTTTTIPDKKKWRDLPVKITDIVWKRRSGFGKFSTDAWERRRFVLQGNVLSYYKGNSHEPMEDETELALDEGRRAGAGLNSSMPDLMATKSGGTASSSGSGSKGTKHKMLDYMEQMAVSAGLAPGTVVTEKQPDEEKKSSARGYMDLIKENAVICATLGHSGAPSPFCLSIKVEGVTKWKLCFSSHRSQLQWMAAISDVIVQASVDIYNVKLLTKADPANHDPTQAFLPHVYEPPVDEQQPSSQTSLETSKKQHLDGEDELLPQPSLHVSGKRLWIMEPYVIKPQNGEDEEDDDSVGSSSSFEDDEEGVENPGSETLKPDPLDDRNIWSLPEKNLLTAAAIINAAILYSRNSTMTVESFWMVVTFANMALFAFLESKPRPEATAVAAPPPPPRKEPKRKKRKGKKSKDSGGAGGTDKKDAGAGGAKVKKEPYKPYAGMSAIGVAKPDDSMENASGDKFLRYRAVDGETLQVRSHGYATTKAKVPSPGTLYELAKVDIFESPARYPDMAPRVKLPKLSYEIDPNEGKTWRAPDHFIVSLSLPTDPPKLGASTSDGGGYTVTMYFTMRKTTRDILKRVTAEDYQPSSEELPEDIQKYQVNAVRLFEEWCKRAANDVKMQTRFKMIPNVVNAKEIGLPSWIAKYNGKPLLIKRPGQTGFLLPHPELSCVEFDISLHVFPYLAKQGICYLKDTMFAKLLASVGFVIEGRDDDELPEVLIGLAQVCYPDPANVMQAAGFFAGTAPRSFEPEDATKTVTKASDPAAAAPAAEEPAVPAQQ